MIQRGRLSIVSLNFFRKTRVLGMVQLLGVVFLNDCRETDIAKNVVLRLEFVSFPYGAKAAHRSSVVFLSFFRKTRSNRGPAKELL